MTDREQHEPGPPDEGTDDYPEDGGGGGDTYTPESDDYGGGHVEEKRVQQP